MQYLLYLSRSHIFADFTRGSTLYPESFVEAIVFIVAALLLITLVGFWALYHYLKKMGNREIPSISKELNRQASTRKYQNEYYELEVRHI